MADGKPFRVEVPIEAPPEAVWSALTVPDQIRQWFGWEHDGLDEEIRYLFVNHADPFPPDRIALDGGQEIQLETDGERTVVRAVMPSVLGGPMRGHDAMEEGWRTFFEQLRFLLKRRPAGRRRTIHLAGTASGVELVRAAESAGVKEIWHDSRYQRMIVDQDGHLVVAAAERPVDDRTGAPASITVNTYGLDDAALAVLRERWADRWRDVATDVEVSG